jgi:hypothetical protein
MKNLMIIGFLVLALVLVQFAQAQTIEDIVKKHEDARGGKAKLIELKSLYMEGATQMMNNEVTIKVTKEQDKLFRTDFELGAGNGFRLYTDKEGWAMFSMRSTTPNALPAEAVAAAKADLDIAGPLVDYAAKGHKAELLGKEAVNGTDCFKIKLTTNSGVEYQYWINTMTYLMEQSAQKTMGRGGVTGESFTIFSDYKAVEGIQFAHSIEIKMPNGGQGSGTTIFDKIELNKPVDPKLYKPE